MKPLLLRIVGVLLILGALVLALTRSPELEVEALVARWAMPPSDFIDLAGQLVHLRDEGPREDPLPIVFLHGTGASLHTWEGWAQGLRATRRVIRFDLPGFGLTGPRADADYHPQADAHFTLALLDHLGVRRAVLVGSSLGGEVAWRAALLAPARIERLVLVAPAGAPLPPEAAVPLPWTIARLPVVNRAVEWVLPRELVRAALAEAWGDAAGPPRELVDRHHDLLLRSGNRRALMQRLAQWQPGAQPGLVAQVTQPTLIVWGGRDRLIPVATAQWFAAQIAGSRIVVFDELGHLPHEEDAARTLGPVADFVGAGR
jgi:pimeloyl-ACP methyl ester carboxylesterase